MKTIETEVMVDPDGTAIMQLRLPGWPNDCTFRREDLYADGR